jgi:hypothetical protein
LTITEALARNATLIISRMIDSGEPLDNTFGIVNVAKLIPATKQRICPSASIFEEP